MKTKQCPKCLRVLPLDAFHRRTRNGKAYPVTKCKDCMRSYSAAWNADPAVKANRKEVAKRYRDANPDKIKALSERGRILRMKPERKAASRRYAAAWNAEDPNRHRAHAMVYWAIRKGKLVRPDTCSKCHKAGRIEAHHHKGYTKPHYFDVVWLCSRCHKIEGLKANPPKYA